ncbi:MAG: DUF493 domain-containing protein [Bdellovibrionales bacterium CG12_big_fil_rev_8_21_14_0_65_38_15]|nr:MAG: DUF493 domain-containing protein [Bdellovibrionales bacterium CG22_combo_CG10-13_8_21_14_all_38_13]PIQ57116.1 MAG: DUF493 domain-containing protein [Bdellovibrionales bacterium CG12_big_fil_rev_8_21_14_0_65_38_15]PIR30146.1 MAG: DUF493 domain-containing protein [Bdellovibrionales bacterium CG11_big_fil_rev_8_21_14_0_20_38_13]
MNDKLKELLDNEYVWPAHYTFKFIVSSDRLGELVEILGNGVEVKESAKGNYVSVTLHAKMDSSDEVLELYKRAAVVKGVISL